MRETIKLIMRAAIIMAKLSPNISVVEKFEDCNALISSKSCFSVSMIPSKIKVIINVEID
jgi:hypothetical protein